MKDDIKKIEENAVKAYIKVLTFTVGTRSST